MSVLMEDPKTAYGHQSTDELLRALLVLGLCSFPPFVKHSERLLGTPAHCPVPHSASRPAPPPAPPLRWLHDALYRHFCAGSGPRDVWAVMNRLRAHNIGAILEFAEEYDTHDDGPNPNNPQEAAVATVATVATAAAAASDGPLRTMPLHDYRSEAQCDAALAALLSAVDTAAALPGPGFVSLRLPALGDARPLAAVAGALAAVAAPFRALDADGDGFVGHAEFEDVFERLASVQGADGVALELTRLFSVDGCGRVDYVAWLQRLELRRVLALAEGLHRLEAAADGPRAEPGPWQLSEGERRRLQALFGRLQLLVERAVSKGVKVMIDAEHGPLRPAVDHIAQRLMRRHNWPAGAAAGGSASGGGGAGSGGAAVLATYQAYLRDTPRRLAADLARAERQGYTLGVKLVCGAYLPQEHRWAAATGVPPPVWDSAAQTHAAFDACRGLLLGGVARGCAEVMLASNSAPRVAAAAEGMAAAGLDPRVAPVYFAQMLGMGDQLSMALGGAGYKVYKFCPYGEAARLGPYLLRRVHETQRVLQAGRQDLRLVQAELWRRFIDACIPGAAATTATEDAASADANNNVTLGGRLMG